MTAMAMPLSCTSIMDDGAEECPVSDTVVMSFKMLTSAPLTGTRADGLGHEEVDSEYHEFEDGINVNDFAFFIFVGKGEDAKLVVKNTDIVSSTDPTMMITGSPGAYTVSVRMSRETLDAKLGHAVEPGSDAKVNFRFVVFANCRSGNTGVVNYDAISGETYKAVVEEAARWHYAMTGMYYPQDGDSDVTGIYKGNIPMFGTNDFETTEGALYDSRPEERIYLGEIDLLRAVAKVRVIDNIPVADKDIYGYPRIDMVQFIGTQDALRQLPYNAAEYTNGTQVHTPNIYAPKDALVTEDRVEPYTLGAIPRGWSVTPVEGNATRVGYVPEQIIANVNGNVAEGMPVFRITVATKGDAGGATEYETYEVPMTRYEDQEFGFGGNILRNHVYTLSVEQVKLGVPAEITMEVTGWNESSLDLDYTTQVNVSKTLEWNSGYSGNDTELGQVVMSPWHAGNAVPLVGTFGISTPENAVWTAELLVREGRQGAFAFLDEAGNQTPALSGTVDGRLSTVRVVSTEEFPAQTNRAELVVTVRLADGTYVKAPICGRAGYGNYTIIQQ